MIIPTRDPAATVSPSTPRWAAPLVLLLVAVQVSQGLWKKWQTDYFSQSYWVVNYSDGFVRRGLGGELLRQVFGEPVPMIAINLAAATTTVVPIIAVVILVASLLRLGTSASVSMAAILAACPLVVDQLVVQRRPDQLGFAVLIALGFALVFAHKPLRWSIGFGAAFAVVSLVHEGTFMYQAAFAALLAVALVPGRSGWIAGVAVASPSAITVAISGLFGAASPNQIEHLTSTAPAELQPRLDHFMGYMGDSPADSVRGVLNLGLVSMAAMAAIGVVLLVIASYLVRRWVGLDLFHALARRDTMAIAVGAIGVTAVVGVSMMTGRDWIRWACVFGSSWLICTAFVVLAFNPTARPFGIRRVPILACLALLPALPAIWAG